MGFQYRSIEKSTAVKKIDAWKKGPNDYGLQKRFNHFRNISPNFSIKQLKVSTSTGEDIAFKIKITVPCSAAHTSGEKELDEHYCSSA